MNKKMVMLWGSIVLLMLISTTSQTVGFVDNETNLATQTSNNNGQQSNMERGYFSFSQTIFDDLINERTTTITLFGNDFTIDVESASEFNMDIFNTYSEETGFVQADLSQIYVVDSAISFDDETTKSNKIIVDEHRLNLEFNLDGWLYSIIPFKASDKIPMIIIGNHNSEKIKFNQNDKNNDKKLDQASSLDSNVVEYEIDKENSELTQRDFHISARSVQSPSHLSLDVSWIYPDLVMAGTSDFYSDHGSGWGSRLVYIFSGSGDNPYGVFQQNGMYIAWDLRFSFVFTSGGPDGTSSNVLTQTKNFISGLPGSDNVFPFHAFMMVHGSNYGDGTLGRAYLDTYGYVDEGSDVTNGGPIGTITDGYKAHSADTQTRQSRYSMIHEMGHIMSAIHSDALTVRTGWCIKNWNLYEVREHSFMNSGYSHPPPAPCGVVASGWFFSPDNDYNIKLKTGQT